MTWHFDYCPSASEGDNQSVWSSAPVVSRCFPCGYNVKLYISRGRLAWWLLAFLHSVCIYRMHENTPWNIWTLNMGFCSFCFYRTDNNIDIKVMLSHLEKICMTQTPCELEHHNCSFKFVCFVSTTIYYRLLLKLSFNKSNTDNGFLYQIHVLWKRYVFVNNHENY